MKNSPFNRRRFLKTAAASALLAGSGGALTLPAPSDCCAQPAPGMQSMGDPVVGKLITLDPAHFHAAVIQGQMLPGIDKRVSIYAPLGPGLLIHLGLIEQFNTRAQNPTSWEMDIHCSPRPLEEMIAARAGNIVVLAGHNGKKILSINASLEAGMNVLGDKPWIIRSEDFPVLESALALANRKHLIAYDLMTERFEITRIIQRALVNDPEVFGKVVPGDLEHPAVIMENVHTINTSNGGRPPFFFDIHDQGTGLSDVGTHLVDLVPWTLFPSQAINYRTDIKVQRGKSWSTPVSLAQYKQVTGTAAFPPEAAPYVQGDQLNYLANNQVDYTIRGVQVRIRSLWTWDRQSAPEPPQGTYRGTNATLDLRQDARTNFRPEVFVVPNDPSSLSAITQAARRRMASLQGTYPGLEAEATGSEVHISVPDSARLGLGGHLSENVAEFLTYMKSPKSVPAWELPNMLAKYFVTTKGVEISRPG